MGRVKTKVLISAAGTLASVSYINHLKSKGYYIIGINSEYETIGKFLCDEYYESPLVTDKKRLKNIYCSHQNQIFHLEKKF